MKPYIITYEIKETATSTYQSLFEEIKKIKPWWHYLDNTWIVMSEVNATEIHNKLKPHLDANINILIFEIGKDRQGWLPPKAWEWLKKHIPK